MSVQEFLVTRDNRVLASGFLIGRLHEHAPQSTGFPRQGSKWFAVSPDKGIVGIVSDRGIAAIRLIRDAGYDQVTLLDLSFEEEPM